jgi:hypothetical protein
VIQSDLEPGQNFRWRGVAGGGAGTAVVNRILRDKDEGMSTEVDQYVALWIEATGTQGSRAGSSFSILLGTDGRATLDGEEIEVKIL